MATEKASTLENRADSCKPGDKTKVAYLVNQYPHVSHSFIRREILALESLGVTVERFSIRKTSTHLADPGDQAEQERTRFLLAVGYVGLVLAVLKLACSRPLKFLKSLKATIRLGRRSERGVARHLVYLAEACVLVKQCTASHVHAHFGTNSTTVALLAHLLGGPSYSFTVHGPEEFDKPLDLSLQEKIERAAAFVVAISDFGRSQLYRWCEHVHWPKIHVVHCGVDASFLGDGPQPIADTDTLVCVGRLSEQKGHLLLLEALAQLEAERVPFAMTLAGDGPLREVCETQIRSLGLESRVRITGWISGEQVRQEILSARVLVLPSFAEGLPVVLMEALALGRPVIATTIAGIPELVENGVNGWLIPAGSITALKQSIAQALQTPRDQLEQMGKSGAVRAKLQHDAAREAAKLASLFQAVLDRNHSQIQDLAKTV